MAKLPTATLTFLDARGREQSNQYQWRSATPPADADVQALAADAQALTALSLVRATVSYEVDITGESDAVEAGASRQNDMSLEVRRSTLRTSNGGTYTFRKLPQPKAAFTVAGQRTITTTDAAWNSFVENFDDGAGVAAIVGDWYISDREELVEGTGGDSIVAAYFNKD